MLCCVAHQLALQLVGGLDPRLGLNNGLDLLPQIDAWLADGKRVALATVVTAWGSAPRPLGAKMAVTADGQIAGSVSGGCVEGAVFEEAQGVLENGRPKLVSYGVTQDVAWSVGLSCGGRIDIFIEPVDAGDSPDEIHVLEFPSTAELDAYRRDARHATLADQRAEAIAETRVYVSQRPVDYGAQ